MRVIQCRPNIGLNWKFAAKLGLWILGKPHSTPGPEPEVSDLHKSQILEL